jgi:hypothetical protein
MDGRTKRLTRLIVAFLNRFAKAPKKDLRGKSHEGVDPVHFILGSAISMPVLYKIMNLSVPQNENNFSAG